MTTYPARITPGHLHGGPPEAKVLTVYALPGRPTDSPAVLPLTYADGHPLPVAEVLQDLPLLPDDALSFACRWFARCDRYTPRLYLHPVLGLTPVCARCAERSHLTDTDRLHIYRKDPA